MASKVIAFPIQRVERDNCPRCGAINGPFERMGSGVCNACLGKRQKPARRQRRKATRR